MLKVQEVELKTWGGVGGHHRSGLILFNWHQINGNTFLLPRLVGFWSTNQHNSTWNPQTTFLSFEGKISGFYFLNLRLDDFVYVSCRDDWPLKSQQKQKHSAMFLTDRWSSFSRKSFVLVVDHGRIQTFGLKRRCQPTSFASSRKTHPCNSLCHFTILKVSQSIKTFYLPTRKSGSVFLNWGSSTLLCRLHLSTNQRPCTYSLWSFKPKTPVGGGRLLSGHALVLKAKS